MRGVGVGCKVMMLYVREEGIKEGWKEVREGWRVVDYTRLLLSID